MRSRSGSTLVELVLVAAILALLAGSLYYIFDQMLKAYSRARGSMDFINNGSVALAKVAEDLERAFVPADPLEDPAHLFFLVGADGAAGAADQVDFNVVAAGGVEELGLRLANGKLLRRREVSTSTHAVPDGTPGGEGSTDETLAASVEDFQVRYHYRTSAAGAFTFESGTPAAAWDSRRSMSAANYSKLGTLKTPDGLPDLVEIRLVVSNPKNANQTRLFKTTVKIAASA